jgi:hypothetical protein
MSTQGGGQWSAADGKLTLRVTAVDTKGGVALNGPGGQSTNIPMTHMGSSEIILTYTCDGDTLSTVQAMPMNSTMTTTYARAEPAAGTSLGRGALAERADAEGQAALRAERHRGVDLRGLWPHIFRREAPQQLDEGERVLDLR